MSEDKFWAGGGVKPSELLAEAKRLAAEFPNRVGKSDSGSCVYTQHDMGWDEYEGAGYSQPVKPVCIVGTAVYNLTGKYVHPDFEGHRIASAYWRLALGADTADEWGDPVFFSDEAEGLAHEQLLDMQIRQDSGTKWGNLLNSNSD